jgi:hypothetical protein
MATDRSAQPSPQAQQPPDCEECGTRKEYESRIFENAKGKQESEETGFRWMNSASAKVKGLFGLNVEQEVNQKDIETTNESKKGKVKRAFNICPNINCDQHIEDTWDIRSWELKKNSNSELTEKRKAIEHKKLKEEMLEDRRVTNEEYDLSVDSSDFKSSDQSSDQSDNANTTDSSSDSSTDESETTTDQTNEATGFGDRVRQWWTENRVRQWVSGRSDNDTHTATTKSPDADTAGIQSTQNQSEEATDKQQASLWEYSTNEQAALSEGEVGQGTNDDYRDINTGMGSSTSESEDFDNDRSNSL